MSLFDVSSIGDFSVPQHREPSILEKTTNSPVQNLLLKATQTLQERWPPVARNQEIHYATAGLWSSHDLLFHLLEQTGPADVWIATWSMTEEPARQLVQKLADSTIRSLQLLLDVRVQVRNPAVYAFIKHQTATIRTSICHAKVTVIRNEHWSFSLIGSANYTNNPRIECGILREGADVAAFHRQWIEAEIAKSKPFD